MLMRIKHWISNAAALALACLASPLAAQRVELQPACMAEGNAAAENRKAIEDHLLRRLDEASRGYERVLEIDPPRSPSSADVELVLRFAPEIRVTPAEPFGLRDVAAVIHPSRGWIAYHLFWEDDIDFPDDNDPCDHEVMWVRLDAERERAVDYFTYFHGRLLRAPRPVIERINAAHGRPAAVVQWGKHGSMPLGWRELRIVADEGDAERRFYALNKTITLEEYNRGTFEKLSTVGRRAPSSPLGRGWPEKFNGEWKAFVDFSELIDIRPILTDKKMILVSPWNNAVLDRHFLPYNFRPKTEWPELMCEDLP